MHHLGDGPVRVARLPLAVAFLVAFAGMMLGAEAPRAAEPAAMAPAGVAFDTLPIVAPRESDSTAVLKLQAIVVTGANPIKDKLTWTVVRPASGDQPAVAVARQTAAQPLFKLPPGDYLVEASWQGIRSQRPISIKASRPTTFVMNFNTGSIKIKMIPYTGAEVISTPVQWDIYPHKKGLGGNLDPAMRVASVSSPQQQFTLPAGQYIVRASYSGTTADLVIPIEAGHTYKYTINLYAANVKLTPVGAKGEDIVWSVFRQKLDEHGNRTLVQTRTGGSPTLLLREGNYIVAARQGNLAGETLVQVAAGTTPKVKVTLKKKS